MYPEILSRLRLRTADLNRPKTRYSDTLGSPASLSCPKSESTLSSNCVLTLFPNNKIRFTTTTVMDASGLQGAHTRIEDATDIDRIPLAGVARLNRQLLVIKDQIYILSESLKYHFFMS